MMTGFAPCGLCLASQPLLARASARSAARDWAASTLAAAGRPWLAHSFGPAWPAGRPVP